jgi:hypothetical protein
MGIFDQPQLIEKNPWIVERSWPVAGTLPPMAPSPEYSEDERLHIGTATTQWEIDGIGAGEDLGEPGVEFADGVGRSRAIDLTRRLRPTTPTAPALLIRITRPDEEGEILLRIGGGEDQHRPWLGIATEIEEVRVGAIAQLGIATHNERRRRREYQHRILPQKLRHPDTTASIDWRGLERGDQRSNPGCAPAIRLDAIITTATTKPPALRPAPNG